MFTRKIPKVTGRFAQALVLLPALMLAPSCASTRVVQLDDSVVVMKGLCQIHFGYAGINWWLLQGSMSSIDITPEPGAQLAGAVVRVFEDANGNGTYDTGESQKSFTSTTSGSGLTVSNITLSAGDVAGWNTSNVSLQVEVTDSANNTSIHSQHL
jgi:hypothetical protein